MKIEMKIITKKKATEYGGRIASINGVSGFWDNPRHESCWIYNGRMPKSNCWIFINDGYAEIHNVMVYDPDNRNSGFGSAMIADIRRAFPNHKIWVDSWNCTRPFWEKMCDRGYVNFIGNDYSWPCVNTTCKTCHPVRIIRRRVFS